MIVGTAGCWQSVAAATAVSTAQGTGIAAAAVAVETMAVIGRAVAGTAVKRAGAHGNASPASIPMLASFGTPNEEEQETPHQGDADDTCGDIQHHSTVTLLARLRG
jgi:hypothetical protein